LMLVAAHGTGTFAELRRICETAAKTSEARGDLDTATRTRLAVDIAVAAAEMLREQARPITLHALRVARWLEALLQGEPGELVDVPRPGRAEIAPDTDETVPWGTLQIEEPPLTTRLPGYPRRTRRWRGSDSGSIPRGWHRWASDQAVFGRRMTVPAPGTVLVDA